MSRQMKDSGVAWIGMMPDGWRIEKGKHVLVYLERPIKDTDSVVTCFRDGQVTLRSNRRELGFTVSLQEIGYKGVEPGDLVVHGMDGFAGSIGISDSRGKCSPVLNILDSEEDKTFLMYYLRMMAYGNVFLALSTGIRERTCDTNWNKLKELPYPVPGRDVQNMIASTLTFKCAEIDKVVEQTRATIEEYKKLKQAIITEAVTKGVRGSRLMKPSGVEWIGDIPAGWKISRIKDLGKCSNGISKSGEYFGTGSPFVTYKDVYDNFSIISPTGLIESNTEEQSTYSVEKDDVFFTRTSETIEEIGFSSVCCQTIPNATFAGFIIRFRPQKGLLYCGYTKYYFRSNIHRSYFNKEMNIVTRASLSQTLLKKLSVLLPQYKEQQEIAAYLDTKCAEIDRIIEKKAQLIEELGSYKKSLIYEYVTGKKEVTA